jgi:DNA-binding MltR family transcriptional regulator
LKIGAWPIFQKGEMKKPKRTRPTHESLWDDRPRLFEVAQTAEDFIFALVATSFLDQALLRFVATCFTDSELGAELLAEQGELGSFGSRARFAGALGLIDSTTYRDLRIIQHVRNDFAHHHMARDFTDPELQRLCAELSYSKMPVINVDTGEEVFIPKISPQHTARTQFATAALHLHDGFLKATADRMGMPPPWDRTGEAAVTA